MNWLHCNSIDDLRRFFADSDENSEYHTIKGVKEVEIMFDDGSPTAVMVLLKDGNTINFCSTKTDCDGCREGLSVTTTKESE